MSKNPDNDEDPSPGTTEGNFRNNLEALQALRAMMLNTNIGETEEDPLPEFPIELKRPNMYYLYVGHGQ